MVHDLRDSQLSLDTWELGNPLASVPAIPLVRTPLGLTLSRCFWWSVTASSVTECSDPMWSSSEPYLGSWVRLPLRTKISEDYCTA